MTQTEKDAWFAHIKTLECFKMPNEVGEIAYEPYYPKSLNFLPVTSPVFMVNDKVYAVITRRVKDEAELEAYLDNNPNVALYYVSMSTDGPMRSFFARFAHIDANYLSPLTIEEFYEKHKDVLNKANVECGTLAGLKHQMEKVDGLGMIFYMTQFIAGIGQPINLRMEKLITDGEFVYV